MFSSHFWKRANCVVNFLLSIALVIGAIHVAFNLITLSSLPPIKCKGNSTDDPQISYKYKKGTISGRNILLITICTPLLEFLVGEFLLSKEPQNVRKRYQSKSRLKTTLLMAFRWHWHYFLGTAFVILLVGTAKITAGRPRPYWIDSCKPQFDQEDCRYGMVYNYTCTNSGLSNLKIRDGRVSFPSAHSALSFYQAICMVLYQTYRLGARRWGPSVVVFLHAIWCCWAMYCSASRLADRHHHLEDIIAGGAVGVVVAWFVVAGLSRKFCALVDAEDQNQQGRTQNHEMESVISPKVERAIRPF